MHNHTNKKFTNLLVIKNLISISWKAFFLITLVSILTNLAFFFLLKDNFTNKLADIYSSEITAQRSKTAGVINSLLASSKDNLLILSRNSVDIVQYLQFMEAYSQMDKGKSRYPEIILLTDSFEIVLRVYSGDNSVWLADGVEAQMNSQILNMRPEAQTLKDGEVIIGEPAVLEIGNPSELSLGKVYRHDVIRMLTPIVYENGRAYLVLTIDLDFIRNIAGEALHSINKYAVNPVTGYFFDKNGWILFDISSQKDAKLSTELSRYNKTGTLGKPGFKDAFLPAQEEREYWTMLQQIKASNSVTYKELDSDIDTSELFAQITSYEPIGFKKLQHVTQQIGGIVFINKLPIPKIQHLFPFWSIFAFMASILLCFFIFIFFVYRNQKDVFILSKALTLSLNSQQYSLPEIKNLYLKNHIKILRQLLIQLKTLRNDASLNLMNERAYESNQVAQLDDIMEVSTMTKIDAIIGKSDVIMNHKHEIHVCAESDIDILIEGETGVGKQLTAEAIHALSPRKDKKFVAINCAELNENLLLDVLFGHKKGAFTGADNDRLGAFAEADGGVLFLDEIQSASWKLQQTFLRVLSERTFRPLGSDEETKVNVRIICATNNNLHKLVVSGEFREDLYFRLNLIKITVPPLKDRVADIPLLVSYFVHNQCMNLGIVEKEITKGALAKLFKYSWPGNIRELKNCITRAVLMSKNNLIKTDEIELEHDKISNKQQANDSFVQVNSTYTEQEHDNRMGELVESNIPKSKKEISLINKTLNNPIFSSLTLRQKQALPFILKASHFTRAEYEGFFGGFITSRTANNDLKKLLSFKIIEKNGSGPSTYYRLTKHIEQI